MTLVPSTRGRSGGRSRTGTSDGAAKLRFGIDQEVRGGHNSVALLQAAKNRGAVTEPLAGINVAPVEDTVAQIDKDNSTISRIEHRG